MLYDQDVEKIKNTAEHVIRNKCTEFKQVVDSNLLPMAVAEAIAEAIRQYDELKK